MAKLTLTDAYVTVAASDESDHVKSLTIEVETDLPDATAMSETWSNALAGALSFTIDVEFYSDFADDDINEDIWAAYVARTTLALAFRPTSGVISAANPELQATCYVAGFPPLAGSHGDVVMLPVKFVNADGTNGLVRDITP